MSKKAARFLFRGALTIALTFASIGGCSSSTTAPTDAQKWCPAAATGTIYQSAAPCSTVDATIVGVDMVPVVTGGCATCAPHCLMGPAGFADLGDVYPLAALPGGACPNEGEICSMPIVVTLTCSADDVRACARDEYECYCKSGSWICARTAQGSGACLPCDFDAGTSGDAGSSLDAGSSHDAAGD